MIAILNVTPDSFSDGGLLPTPEHAARAAEQAASEGACMIDIGGESTRPGASRVSAVEQIRRVVPAIHAIRSIAGIASEIPISIDTTLAPVAAAALDAGADAINDVSAGTEDPDLLPLASRRGASVIVMHRRTPPGEDSYSDRYQNAPTYADVVREVLEFLLARARLAESLGIARESIMIDPGLGFGKSVDDNLALVRGMNAIVRSGYPVLGAASRKSFVGRVSLGRDSTPSERLAGSLAMAGMMHAGGIRLFRVHDVAAHVQFLQVLDEIGKHPFA